MIATTDGTKVCKTCLDAKPIGEFRRRSRDGEARLNQCRACHNEAERRCRATSRAKREDKTLNQFAADLSRGPKFEQVAAICGKMVERFGGLDGFVENLYSHYVQTSNGSFRRWRILKAIICLIVSDSARRDAAGTSRGAAKGGGTGKPSENDYNQWSDEELEREYECQLAAVAAKLAGSHSAAKWRG